MSNNELYEHKRSDTVKWVLTLFAFILVGVMLAGIILGWFDKKDELPVEEEQTEQAAVTDGEGNAMDEDTVYLWTKVDEVSGNYPADCTTIGQGILRCKDCGTVFIVPVTGAHTYGEGVLTKPTCEDPGYITYTCTKDAAHKLVIDQAALEKAQTEELARLLGGGGIS